jgi:serine/threonine protein kinase
MDGKWPCIVMEYCAGGSLDKLLFVKRQLLTEKQIYKLLYDIATGN